MQLDFTSARKLIATAEAIMDEIEGFTYEPDVQVGPGRRNNPELAKVTRELTQIGDFLFTASGEMRLQFHKLKGIPDPRD